MLLGCKMLNLNSVNCRLTVEHWAITNSLPAATRPICTTPWRTPTVGHLIVTIKSIYHYLLAPACWLWRWFVQPRCQSVSLCIASTPVTFTDHFVNHLLEVRWSFTSWQPERSYQDHQHWLVESARSWRCCCNVSLLGDQTSSIMTQ